MPKKKKPYFHNSVEAIRQAPSEYFEEIEYEDFMDWKIAGWEIPASVDCIIRERNLVTNKIKEYVYQRSGAAHNKLRERMALGDREFTVCRADAIHLLRPNTEDPYDDPLA